MIEIGHKPAQNLVEIRVSGELTADDYDKAIPELEQAIEQADGALNAVVALDDLRGWDMSALWKDLKFDVKHYDDFRRIAIIGQTDAEKIGAKASSVFTSAVVEFFQLEENDEAQAWATGK